MSRRQYINPAYLTTYLAGQTLNSDFNSVNSLIEFAEQMIDGYVGTQRRWFQLDSSFVAGIYTPPDYEPETPVVKELRGRITAIITDNLTYALETWQANAYQNGFFQMCNMDIIGGKGMGTSYLISASSYIGQVSITNIDGTAVTGSPIDATSIYRIYQLGKFPRDRDVFYNTFTNPTTYYKAIPEAVREATAAQAQYINTMGIAFFTSADATLVAEHAGSYGYQRDLRLAGGNLLIAPQAKLLLKGIMNRKGRIII